MLENRAKYMVDIRTDFCVDKVEVHGNEGKLHQIFLNLITNALQSIEEKGAVEVRTRLKDDKVEVCVQDNGLGIPADMMDRIIDPFFTTKSPGEGTGLGLSIAHTEIQRHGGELRFESQVGKGTSVYVYLPLSNPSI